MIRTNPWVKCLASIVAIIAVVVAGGHDLHAAEGDSAPAEATTAWTYDAEAAGTRPVARSIELTTTPPDDLTEDVTYVGSRRLYAQLRYGSENSGRVAIVIDELDDGEYAFYVDANRDRRIAMRDFVSGTGRTRTCPLNVEIARDEYVEHEERRIQLRLGITRTRLSVATLGGVEGEIPPVDGLPQPLRGRRIDGNANGLFADARDRLLIDIDGDGRWDPVAEQFTHLPVLTLNGRRFAVRSDRLGRRLGLSEITGIGQLRVAVNLAEGTRITEFEAMVYSDDGSAYSLRQPDAPLSVPVGRYALGSVSLTVDDGKSDSWHFVFSRSGSVGKNDWVSVAADETVTLEAVGKTRFVLNVEGGTERRAGDSLTVKPRLYTQNGLLINFSCRGERVARYSSRELHNQCDIKLTTGNGNALSAAQSGFS